MPAQTDLCDYLCEGGLEWARLQKCWACHNVQLTMQHAIKNSACPCLLAAYNDMAWNSVYINFKVFSLTINLCVIFFPTGP